MSVVFLHLNTFYAINYKVPQQKKNGLAHSQETHVLFFSGLTMPERPRERTWPIYYSVFIYAHYLIPISTHIQKKT